MAFTSGRPRGVPRTPTLFHGERIAVYESYAEAQRAVDYLSDERFPVQNVAIVGTDLRLVERVTGRLTYPRVALAGAATGAYFGLFIGLLLFLFAAGDGSLFVAALLLGAGAGMLFGVVSYTFTGGRRDFTSASQIVASQYAVLCVPEVANRARNTLRGLEGARVVESGLVSNGPPAGDSPRSDVRPSGGTDAGGAEE